MTIGTHIILDLFGCTQNLTNLSLVEKSLTDAAIAVGATILETKSHYFEPQGGVSGIVLLAESHVSIHTWPEYKFAAVDIFVCGKLDPLKAQTVFQEAFNPSSIELTEIKRGRHEQLDKR